MENYKNLNFSAEQINQKLAWVGDKSKLATTLQETPVNQFMFTKDQKTLKTIIDANNQIITVETNDMITEPGSKLESWNVYVDHLLCINSIACEGTMCSHNYVELGNGSKKDINLNGLYLLYTDCSKRLESDIGYVWQYLPLTGVIKAGSTFVIRGKQTNTIKGSMIKVDSYDMEWDIEFKQNKAPTYVTCQATGYKLISNKEQPSGDAYRIPWLLAYFPAATSSSNPKENTAQHKPMYIKYDVSDTNIKITAVQINGIWEVDSSSTKYDFNNQIENLTIDKMTLSTSTEEDLAIYSPDNQNFYTLKLQ